MTTLTATGDLMLATIAVRGGAPVVNAPGGWTLVRRSNTSSSAANANSLLVYRRLAAAGEPNTQTWTFSASQGVVGCISTFQGVNSTTPVEVSSSRTTASSLSHATPGVTTLTANTLVVTCHALGSNATWTPPTGMNEIADLSVGAPNTAGGIALGISWQTQAAIAATGARTATAASNAAIGNAAIFVLRD